MKCEHKSFTDKEVTFKNGTTHIERRCADCKKFIKYVSQGKEYVFHFGKYNGKTLNQVIEQDYDYVYWCLENFEGSKKKKLQESITNLLKQNA